MNKPEKSKMRAFALYSFIDMETESKCGVTPNTYSKDYPNPYTKHNAAKNLLAYAFKQYFDICVEKQDYKKIRFDEHCFEGVHYSISFSLRAVCVCVSNYPNGVSVNFATADDFDFYRLFFCENELNEYRKNEYGDDTLGYTIGKKYAYRKKYNLMDKDMNVIDSTTQDDYSLHKDTFLDRTFRFVATNNAKFIKIDISTILP